MAEEDLPCLLTIKLYALRRSVNSIDHFFGAAFLTYKIFYSPVDDFKDVTFMLPAGQDEYVYKGELAEDLFDIINCKVWTEIVVHDNDIRPGRSHHLLKFGQREGLAYNIDILYVR